MLFSDQTLDLMMSGSIELAIRVGGFEGQRFAGAPNWHFRQCLWRRALFVQRLKKLKARSNWLICFVANTALRAVAGFHTSRD
jgi:hypothetical protein